MTPIHPVENTSNTFNMNRPIKFRAHYREGRGGEGMFDVNEIVVMQDGSWHINGEYSSNDLHIMQFTGLTDKNGKECFEGDIVLRYEHSDHCEIVYRDDWGAFAFKGKTSISTGWSHLYSGHSVHPWEIISNIYENPELLK